MLTIFLKVVGTREYPRYLVTERMGFFWTGQVWTDDEEAAMVFADAYTASVACKDLQHEHDRQCSTSQKFTLPVSLYIWSKGGVDLDSLREWVRQTLDVRLTNWSGPSEDFIIGTQVDFSNLSEQIPF